MYAILGTAGVLVAFVGAGLLAFRGYRVATGHVHDLKAPAGLLLGGSIVAFAAMELALLVDDFSIAYLANHHSTATPFPWDFATAWAALEGSILVWGLVLAVFTAMVARAHRRKSDPLGAGALAVLGGVALFFFGLMLTVANPFEVCIKASVNGCLASSPWPFAAVDAPLNGPGPNPLLQNHILMAIHPPILYLGYVGLSVPFAFAISALALKVPGPEWLRRSHRSTLIAWSFLGLGILLGGWWAYEVLSWGGYWAWDPVENASLMPWLIATAFLHSGIVQQRRNMLQAWNFVLVISAFALTILGTFLTRSGTINSVHSFTQSAIGPALLGFLVLVLVGSFSLFATRSHLVSSSPRIESFMSREGTFLANNLLLTVYAFVVLIGTTYPLILEAFTGTQVGVGEPFYNRLAVPLSFALLLAMGLGPATPWGTHEPGLVWRRIRLPLIIAASAAVLTVVTITRNGWVVIAIALGAYVAGVIVGVLVGQVTRRRSKLDLTPSEATRSVIGGDVPFWAGQLSHLGLAILAIGIAFTANLGTHMTVDMVPGQTVEFHGYDITYESPFQQQAPNKVTRGARLSITKDGEFVATMEPAANFFGGGSSGVSTPDVLNRPGGDLYITLLDLDSESATLAFDTSPMVLLIWLGGLIVAGGGFWSMSARRKERKTVGERPTADV